MSDKENSKKGFLPEERPKGTDTIENDNTIGKYTGLPETLEHKEIIEKPVAAQSIDELIETAKQEEFLRLKEKFDEDLQLAIRDKKNTKILNKSRIAIMVPVNENISFRWAAQLWRLQRQSPANTEFFPVAQYGVAYARERCVDMFCKLPPDFTHMLFLDTDIIPADYALTTLLQDDKPIVSGIYANSLHTGLAAWNNEAALQYQQLQQQSPDDPLVEVDKTGMGLCLIQRDVFKMMLTIEKPWFYYKVDEQGPHSEDFYFFSLVRRLGIKPFVDLRVACMHMKPAVVQPNGAVGL